MDAIESWKAKEAITIHFSTVQTAKLIRAALKAGFPGVKFSITSKTYSGGSSIDISWVDGPTKKAVHAIADKFQSTDFDGSIDLTTYRESTLILQADGTLKYHKYHSGYVFCNRHLSAAAYEKIGRGICADYGKEFPGIKQGVSYVALEQDILIIEYGCQYLSQLIHRAQVDLTLPITAATGSKI